MSVEQRLRRSLWSGPRRSPAEFLSAQRHAYDRAILLARAYYALGLVWIVQQLNSWTAWSRLDSIKPLWPADWWFGWFSVNTSVDLLFVAYIAATIVAILLPERRLARAAYSLTLLQFMAVHNSFGKINHSWHAWLFVGLVFILLPDGGWRERRRIADRHYFLTVFWAAQLVVLFFYTLTGVWKVWIGLQDLVAGELSAFHLSGFSYIAAQNLVQTGRDTAFGEFVATHEVIGWALFIGTMYIETFSVLVACRPRLHRVWGLGLVLFHVSTQLVLGFSFLPNIVLLSLILVCSPLTPDDLDVRAAVLDLPGVRMASRMVLRSRRIRVGRLAEGAEPRAAPST